MAIEFPPLPFALDALTPYISKRTLEFHYGKHHKHYVDTLNKLIAGTEDDDRELEEIMEASCEKKPAVFNNAAQAWNHAFYWNCLTDAAEARGRPTPKFENSLEKRFGSFTEFREEFVEAGKKLFGSGWVWLVKDKRGALKIRALPNAENPTLDGEVPLLVCDVWEHAYYLDYQNERPKYLQGFWSIVNWDFVETSAELAPGRTRHFAPALRGIPNRAPDAGAQI